MSQFCSTCGAPLDPDGQCRACGSDRAPWQEKTVQDWQVASSSSVSDLSSRFKLFGLLGEIGIAAVYKAHDVQLDVPVTLLRIEAEAAAAPGVAVRLMSYAESTAQPSHEAVLPIGDFGEAPDGSFYLVAPVMQDPTLRSLLLRDTRLSGLAALRVGLQLAGCIEAAHLRQQPFGLFTPASIFVGFRGERPRARVVPPTVVALLVDDYDPAAERPVTPIYASPEALKGLPEVLASDVFRLGVVLYEMLTGEPPFDGSKPAHAAARVLTADIKPVNACAPGADPKGELTAFVSSLVAKKPSSRPTIDAVSTGLMALLERRA